VVAGGIMGGIATTHSIKKSKKSSSPPPPPPVETKTRTIYKEKTIIKKECPVCHGKGKKPCSACERTGNSGVKDEWGNVLPCKRCKGTGCLNEPCNNCDGEGYITE
jgi:DnaJ-class molecular chaperone